MASMQVTTAMIMSRTFCTSVLVSTVLSGRRAAGMTILTAPPPRPPVSPTALSTVLALLLMLPLLPSRVMPELITGSVTVAFFRFEMFSSVRTARKARSIRLRHGCTYDVQVARRSHAAEVVNCIVESHCVVSLTRNKTPKY